MGSRFYPEKQTSFDCCRMSVWCHQTEVHMRKPHHPAFAPGPTSPLQATIRSSVVHGGPGSIDLDQGLADNPGGHIRLGAGHGYDGAGATQLPLVVTFDPGSTPRNLPDARVGGGNDPTLSRGRRAH